LQSVDFSNNNEASVTRESLLGYSQLAVQPFTFVFLGELDNLQQVLTSIEGFPVPVELTTVSYAFGEDSATDSSFIGTLADNPSFRLSITGIYYFWNTAR
jgi:hypothetical protein